MSKESPPTTPRPRRRWWKWTKRFLWTLLLLLVVAGIFHKTIIFTVLNWGGPKFAARIGLPLTWNISGSLWGDVEIKDVKVEGGADHWLPRATVGELKVDYDVRSFFNAERERAVKSVTLRDLSAELDLRNLPPVDVKASDVKPPARAPGTAPALIWPRTLDLNSIDADVTLKDGRRLVVRGLSLRVGDGMPGTFQCRELRMEPDGPFYEQLRASIDLQPRKLTIRNLIMENQFELDQLALDLTRLEAGVVVLNALAHLGPAEVRVDATAGRLFSPPRNVTADVAVKGLNAREAYGLGLPNNVYFEDGALGLHVEGDPMAPPDLKADATFSAASIRAAGARLDKAEVVLNVADSQADLKVLKVTRGANLVEVTGKAGLPPDLKDWKQIVWNAAASATVADLAEILDRPPPASGQVKLTAKAAGVGPTPTSVTGEILGDTLAYKDYRLPRLRTLLSLDGKEATVELPALELGAGNQVSVKATMQMEDNMPVQAGWKIGITDTAALFSTTGLKPPPQSVSGILATEGAASFAVKDLGDQNFSAMLADVKLEVREAVFEGSPLPAVAMEIHAKEGKAAIKPLGVRFDDENHLDFSGEVTLRPPYAFTTQGTITLPKLPALNKLLTSFKAPGFESGSLFTTLNATGRAQPLEYQGALSLSAAKVRTAKMPNAADVALETTFEGTRADLAKLQASLGPWKVSAKGVVDKDRADLAELKVWQNKTLLLNGRARAPLKFNAPDAGPLDIAVAAKDLKINEIAEAAGIKNIPAAVLNADIAIQGRADNPQGKILVKLTGLKAPNAPKAFQPATVTLDVNLADKRVKADLVAAQPPLQNLTASVDVPLDLAQARDSAAFQNTPLKVKVDLPESDLSFLREYAPTTIRSLPVRARLQADITGTPARPVINAAFDLDLTEIGWVQASMPSVRDVHVRVRAVDRKITIENLTALLAGGRISANGSVDAADFKQPLISLNLQAREALAFRDPTTSVRANADITCQGTLQAARVAGTVELVRGRVFKEIDLMPMLKLPADVPPVPPDTQRSEARLALPAMMKDWTFAVKVRTRDPVLISGNLVNGAVSADMDLGGTGAAPLITGGANVDRMLLKLPFSMVKITKGAVTMNPQRPLDPELDLRGESNAGSYAITLYIYGPSTAPKTRFTSSPPLSETDIVTLLATGTTLNGSPDELAAEAATRAGFLFVSEIYRKVFNKKKVVREEPPKLHLTFNPSGADRANDNVQAAYDLTDKFRVTARFAQSGRVKLLLGYLLRFGKAAQATPTPEAVKTTAQTQKVAPVPEPAPGQQPVKAPGGALKAQ